MLNKITWDEIIKECSNCTKCELCKSRKNVVIGRGNIHSKLLLVGEGPGKQEDEQGLPFVGPAGKLLSLLLDALLIKEDMYYITNIVKCRPPLNRVPYEEEANMCMPYLRNQVRLINPKIIVCMGATSIKYLVDKNEKITQIRGQWIKKQQFWMMPTFHPAALLRDETKKECLWEDFKKVKEKLYEIQNET